MKQIFKILTLSILISLFVFARDEQAKDPNEPDAFETYYMVFLKRGPKAAELTDHQMKDIQSGHLAHLSWLSKEGYTHIAGPFEVAADYPLRGIVIYRADLPIEKVKELAEMDPAVKAGRLQVEVLKWWVPAGMMKWKK